VYDVTILVNVVVNTKNGLHCSEPPLPTRRLMFLRKPS